MNRAVETPRRDVRFAAQSCELFAVPEDAEAQRFVLGRTGPLVLVGKGKEVCDLKHDRTIGYFTAPVNGFLTDAL